MNAPLKVCLWATTFQANIYSLARYLGARPQLFSPLVVLKDLEQYRREPINQLLPQDYPLLDSDAADTLERIERFEPTVLVIDNHFPPARVAPGLVNVWHGFGWRGPEDREAFSAVFAGIKKHTGASAAEPNPLLRWISAGPTNREYRIRVSGLHADNVRADGQAFVDDVMAARWRRQQLDPFYPASFRGRRIVLFAPTWHFGRLFAHWGDDIALLGRLFAFLDDQGAALIFRMHDRKRFDSAYLRDLELLASRHPHVVLKYKDGNQDNLLDISIADVMISNYSSILTFFYATGRPSIHIYPIARDAHQSIYRYWKRGKVREVTRTADYIWSLDPQERGGLTVDTPQQLEQAIGRALAEPDCCAELSKSFVAKHCAPYDGNNCERIAVGVREVGERALSNPTHKDFFANLLGR